MTNHLDILPDPALKPEITKCALLEGNVEGWIICCSERFLPLAQRIAKDDSLAEDALQISWIKVLQSINHAYFDGPKACPWVGKIVANTAKNLRHQRQRRREAPLYEIEASSRTPEDLAQERQMLGLLRESIALLPETYRQVIELRVVEGFSTRQTANLLHVSLSNVSTRLHRAVKLLQRRIDARIRPTSDRETKG
ncbi:MAG: sigma-70 family RNA polymerase sigma factor [Acidobacteriota bacterium]|nr:sigma-70 family RNA polymerase sigma factor [Acidobacteriota bacterium]